LNKIFTPVLTVAGSDNSGGAGLQADLKTFMAHNCYGLSAVSAITVQNIMKFEKFEAVAPSLVYDQIKTAIELTPPLAVKTGMLATSDNIDAVANAIQNFNLQKIVIDPVLKSSTGKNLISENFINTLRKHLIPLAYVITPNKMEAEYLTDIKIQSYEDVKRAAEIIFEMGAKNVIIKGGHLEFDEDQSTDTLFNGKTHQPFSVKKIKTAGFHGTGCTFSASLCANLALGLDISEATKSAKDYTLNTMIQQCNNTPAGVLNHIIKRD